MKVEGRVDAILSAYQCRVLASWLLTEGQAAVKRGLPTDPVTRGRIFKLFVFYPDQVRLRPDRIETARPLHAVLMDKQDRARDKRDITVQLHKVQADGFARGIFSWCYRNPGHFFRSLGTDGGAVTLGLAGRLQAAAQGRRGAPRKVSPDVVLAELLLQRHMVRTGDVYQRTADKLGIHRDTVRRVWRLSDFCTSRK